MMTTKEMKEVLYQKIKDEGCSFKKSDIKINKAKNGYKVQVEDFMPIKLILTKDDYFGYMVMAEDEFEDIYFGNSKIDYPLHEAMVYIGYYVGTRY